MQGLAWVVLVHDTGSNDWRSNDVRFMHKLCLSLHAIIKLAGRHSLHCIEKLKDFTDQVWFPLLNAIIRYNLTQFFSTNVFSTNVCWGSLLALLRVANFRACCFRSNLLQVLCEIGFFLSLFSEKLEVSSMQFKL